MSDFATVVYPRSLSSKIILLCCGIATAVGLLTGGLFYLRTVDRTLEMATEHLAAETRLIAGRLQSAYDIVQNDVRIISGTAPIAGLVRAIGNDDIDPLDGSTSNQWRIRLIRIFQSVLKVSPHYTQMRFIGLADNGRELVRINRTSNGLRVVRTHELQQKSNEHYVKQVLSGHTRFFFTAVTLNRESGKIAKELIPTLRAVMPISDGSGVPFGMIVINVNFNAMTQDMFRVANLDKNTFLINQSGDYVEFDPITQTTHLEQHERYSKKKPAFIEKFQAAIADEAAFSDNDHVSYYARMKVSKSSDDEFVGAVLRVPRTELLADTRRTKFETILLTLFLVVTTGYIAAFAARKLMSPLVQMTQRLRAANDDDHAGPLQLPVDSRDETGDLARAFERMTNDLIDSENRASSIFENATDGIFIMDADSLIEKLNPACARIFGYKHDEIIGQSITMMISAPFQYKHDRKSGDCLETREGICQQLSEELEVTRKDGSTVTIDLSISSMQIGGKHLYTGIIRDITQKKADESELRLLKLAVNYSQDLLLITTADLEHPVIVFASDAALLMTGYSPDELIGQTPRILQGDKTDKDQLRALKDSLQHDQPFTTEVINYTKNGGEYWVQMILVPVVGDKGKTTHFAAIERDTTTSRNDKEELLKSTNMIAAVSQSQARFIAGDDQSDIFSGTMATILDLTNSQFAVINEVIHHIDGTLSLVLDSSLHSAAHGQLFNSDEALNNNTSMSSCLKSLCERTLTSGERVFSKESCADGHQAENPFIDPESYNLLGFPLKSSTGRIVGVVGLARTKDEYDEQLLDYLHPLLNSCASIITARNHEKLQEQAELKVEEYTRALERSNKELDDFAYSASHDLKAPLRVIDNTSRWLEEDLEPYLDDDSRENITLMRNRAKRMEMLLDDLLEYSRIGRKMDESYAQIISGEELAASVLQLLSYPESFNIEFSPDFLNHALPRMPLQQVLLNLISNAIKQHDKNSGTVSVDFEDHEDNLMFSVRDDGPGIASEFHEQIFNMFKTLKPRDQVEGSGMGLAMVKKHIEHFGGKISLESEEGIGCIFRFSWPLKQASFG